MVFESVMFRHFSSPFHKQAFFCKSSVQNLSFFTALKTFILTGTFKSFNSCRIFPIGSLIPVWFTSSYSLLLFILGK